MSRFRDAERGKRVEHCVHGGRIAPTVPATRRRRRRAGSAFVGTGALSMCHVVSVSARGIA